MKAIFLLLVMTVPSISFAECIARVGAIQSTMKQVSYYQPTYEAQIAGIKFSVVQVVQPATRDLYLGIELKSRKVFSYIPRAGGSVHDSESNASIICQGYAD